VVPACTLTCQIQQQQQWQQLSGLASLLCLRSGHSQPAHSQLPCSRSRSSLVRLRCCVLSCTCLAWTGHKLSSGSVHAVLCGSSSSSSLIPASRGGCQLLLLLPLLAAMRAAAAHLVALQQQPSSSSSRQSQQRQHQRQFKCSSGRRKDRGCSWASLVCRTPTTIRVRSQAASESAAAMSMQLTLMGMPLTHTLQQRRQHSKQRLSKAR
jgi:hypothetical protein